MVWGCFQGTSKRKGPLIPIIHHMISSSMQLEDILFQQDNAPVHKTYSVMDWFEMN